jgi:acetyltransferase-like isoleucine patch superfamily enzyme
VIVEDDVYLGMGVRILPDLTIGRGTVVGAGSVVRKSLPPFALAAGVPAHAPGRPSRVVHCPAVEYDAGA